MTNGSRNSLRHRRRSRRSKVKRLVHAGVAIVLLAAAVASWWLWDIDPRQTANRAMADGTSGEGEAAAPMRVMVKLPEDDAPHQNYMEWWYYNSHLRARDGREFSFHYVFFLINSVVSYTVSHISLTDHQTGKHYTDQKESAGNPSAGTVRGFNFTLGDWGMAGSAGDDALRIKTADFAFDLTLSNSGPTVFQGGTGLLDFKQAGTSYYYSRPRMSVEGQLSLGSRTFPVVGQSWFDHQWGDFQTGVLGWDWFALQLDDGADVMLYQLRDRRNQPVLFSGTYTRNGTTEVLGERDFSAQALSSWRSKSTGISYQTSWRVHIPSHRVDLQIAPVAQDSEIDARTTTYNTYWEGAIKVSGSHGGRGFLEISPAGPQKPDQSADQREANRH